MSDTSLHESKQRLDALLMMIREDGATPAGEVPGPDHIEALEQAPIGRADEVRQAHAEGRGPPDFAGSSGSNGSNGRDGGPA